MIINFPMDRARKVNYTFECLITHQDGKTDSGMISVDAPNVIAAEALIREKVKLMGNSTLTLNPVWKE
jgi:hypothetical protein